MDSISTTKVFIPHEEHVWVTGELIAEDDQGTMEVRIVDAELPLEANTIKINTIQIFGSKSSLPLQNLDLPAHGVDDMCSLSYLHEPSILDNLRR